ncbi:MAG: AAA family ATPase, partial [Spirochaetes bacterium]|nr:AAA family ATPase [Spirochaetota bacterium]
RGESGTGKELVARIIHSSSERSEAPFVAVNVAALPETLVESELFGHVKGSFTGATSDRVGRFEEANGGTLFIDEIGDISASVQVKLLRAIQFGEVQRVGANRSMTLDVRIITATNRNLEEMITDNTFREDLYYRLNVIQIDLPPLRDRKTDIPPLVDQFIQRYAEKNKKIVNGITFEALDALMKYDFPGNVRELENIVERSVVLCRSDRVTVRDIPDSVTKADTQGPAGADTGKTVSIADAEGNPRHLEGVLAEAETALILKALSATGGNQVRAAALLGVSERKLRSRMERLSLDNTFAHHDS